jgi:hypothetical protein
MGRSALPLQPQLCFPFCSSASVRSGIPALLWTLLIQCCTVTDPLNRPPIAASAIIAFNSFMSFVFLICGAFVVGFPSR